MSENEQAASNICSLCGGVMTSITWHIEAPAGTSMSAAPVWGPVPLHFCYGHPAPERHDGKLDENYRVYQSHGAFGVEGMILEYKGTTQAIIKPAAALALLVWLEQERTDLEQLAKEQQ